MRQPKTLTRLAKFIRELARRLVGELYDGPGAPRRLRKYVEDFADLHPHATRDDWITYTIEFANESYRSGYVRGYEDSVRVDLDLGPSPEMVADAMDPAWRDDDRAIVLEELQRPVPDTWQDEIVMADALVAAWLANSKERQ